MGIHVDEFKAVRYSPSDHSLIDSRVDRNPILQKASGFDVVSVFRRVRIRSGGADGNPFIYALKNVKGYSIDLENVLAFKPDFNGVLEKVSRKYAPDYVVPVPSGSRIAAMFARRVRRYTGGGIEVDWLRKKYNRDVCKDIDSLIRSGRLSRKVERDLQTVRASLGRSLSTVFSMKNIDATARQYIEPFSLTPGIQFPSSGQVLLVDDLLATGSSLLCAKGLLEAQGLEVVSICLLSSTDKFSNFT